ncbi:MAG: hypothetical protein JO250_22995 [Armatimonadetes bacterium]|nr:hypothetical protein [Armatimonadota bacterium]
MSPKKFESVPLPSPESIDAARRAVVEFTGVDQAGPSYEARVFLNNPDAGPETPPTAEHGYAGSFHVYGYGLSPEGDPAGSARLPMRRSLVATDAVRRAAASGDAATVTVVPVLPGGGASAPDLLTADGVSIRAEDDGAPTPNP